MVEGEEQTVYAQYWGAEDTRCKEQKHLRVERHVSSRFVPSAVPPLQGEHFP